ncbi:hypothetical protein CLAVI_000579 [Candidatus Clavichlamydia salmonicola]|uniref:hypothetical protein n=1 Tax=Candidatus Clavichlamydia salmonicola TaxID=469812 RepID=UPI0018917319|nr:hypothetical protein [Candidatus Clavichlamydia salmonicola]MBF5050956.1 hypothetical protein [Candidatus Clavichlamydia salmonicola]
MSSVMNLLGRRPPGSFKEACHNIKVNMCSLGKVFRIVTSAALGAAGVALVTSCKTCGEATSCNVNGTSLVSAAPSNPLVIEPFDFFQSWEQLEVLGKVCLVAGAAYGFSSLVVVVTTLTGKIIIPCVRSSNCMQDRNPLRKRSQDLQEIITGFLPRLVAGSIGTVYGGVAIPMAMLKLATPPSWPIENAVLGYGAAGWYFLDAGIACYDLTFKDLFKLMEKKDEEEVEQIMLEKKVQECVSESSTRIGEECSFKMTKETVV